MENNYNLILISRSAFALFLARLSIILGKLTLLSLLAAAAAFVPLQFAECQLFLIAKTGQPTLSGPHRVNFP